MAEREMLLEINVVKKLSHYNNNQTNYYSI